jgi:pilus assembly protein CpaE
VSGVRVVAIGGDASFRPQVARALLASPDSVAWAATLPDAAILASKAQSLDLVVLGPTIGDDQAARVAERLAKEAPATAVVLVREEPANGSFPRLVRSGVRDVVDLEAGPTELEDALRRALQWSAGVRASHSPGAVSRGRLVSVFSTKGGTGKTFLACNLAVAAAARLQRRVALVDSDHDLGDVFSYFNAEPRRSLHELVALDEGADPEAVMQLGTPLDGNVMAYGSPPDPRAEPIHARAMEKVLRGVQEAFPLVIVDASAEYSDHVLSVFDMSDVICLITSLDVIGVRHMSLAMQTLENLGVPRERFRVVLNRADSKVELGSREIEKILEIKVDAFIPSSSLVPRSINRGRLLMLEEPRSAVARSIAGFAEKIVSDLGAMQPPKAEQRPRLLTRKA